MAGGLHPLGFHVVNIILHGVASVLFLSAFTLLLGDQSAQQTRSQNTPQDPPFVSKAAFLTTLLFTVHPVHTESVSYLCLVSGVFVVIIVCYRD